jgi:hypothetical protein
MVHPFKGNSTLWNLEETLATLRMPADLTIEPEIFNWGPKTSNRSPFCLVGEPLAPFPVTSLGDESPSARDQRKLRFRPRPSCDTGDIQSRMTSSSSYLAGVFLKSRFSRSSTRVAKRGSPIF